MVASVCSQQFYTMVMQRGDADHIVGSSLDLNCDFRVQDIKSRSRLEDLDLRPHLQRKVLKRYALNFTKSGRMYVALVLMLWYPVIQCCSE
jgi:hypothetical protein